METSARLALSVGAAAALLAGCGGFQPQTDARLTAIAATPLANRGYKVIYSFSGNGDAEMPSAQDAPLVFKNGLLYGTTITGGNAGCAAFGCGTAYQVDTSGTEKVIYRFGGEPDAGAPSGPLIDLRSKWYGVSVEGGSSNNGTVFSVDQSGSEHVVYSFKGGSDGTQPYGQLVALKGTLYGTTNLGGTDGLGTVFALTPSGNETVVHSFKYRRDGAHPVAGLTLLDGKLYGTTTMGGTYTFGTVFSIDASRKERVVYSFKYGTDGATPGAALIAISGILYGTTTAGGGQGYLGTVFRVSPSGAESVLHRFQDSSIDGQSPEAQLLYHNGKFYGTTSAGGKHGDGIAFALTSSDKERVLYDFSGTPDGMYPAGGLTVVNETLYGTTSGGGTGPCFHNAGCGTVFALTP